MASPSRPTLANLKNKKSAVIYLSTKVDDIPEVPENAFEFDWFNTAEAASNCFDDIVAFNKRDVSEHGKDIAFVTIEVTDTKKMEFGRFDVQPRTAKTREWLAEVQKDPMHFAVFPDLDEKEKSAKKAEAKKTIKPRAKKAGATVTKIEDAPTKKAAAKKTVVKKVSPKKATGEAAPKAPAKKTSKAPAKASQSQDEGQDKTERLRQRLKAKQKVTPAKT